MRLMALNLRMNLETLAECFLSRSIQIWVQVGSRWLVSAVWSGQEVVT